MAVALLMEGERYYVGGLWAFTHHRLTTQQFASRIEVFTNRRHMPRVLGHARVNFHVLTDAQLHYGIKRETIERVAVEVSDPERTVLDALDMPKVVGGVRSALEFVTNALPRIERKRLIDYAASSASSATCQRLGLLLERDGATERELRPLQKRVRETRSLISLVPSAPRHGHVNPNWRVVENDA
jgi:predicted transcriptional regulator of viral defense system